MEHTPIDDLLAIETLKDEVAEVYKEKKAKAEDFLADARDSIGVTGLTAPMFEGCGEFKYSTTKAKTIVGFDLESAERFEDWVNDNAYTAFLYLKDKVTDFGKWCQDNTGEVPDGVNRTETHVPAGYGAPKFYRKDPEKVKEVLSAGGNFFEGANRLLLGDGDA